MKLELLIGPIILILCWLILIFGPMIKNYFKSQERKKRQLKINIKKEKNEKQ